MDNTQQTNFDDSPDVIAREMGKPYPNVLKYDEHGARYGITKTRFGLDNHDDPNDPYGVVIEYFDKKTKQQGSVKLMHHQVDVRLWPALNDAINLILVDALERVRG